MIFQYFIIAGSAFLLFYVIFKGKMITRKVQQRFPQWKDLKREICASFLTCVVFAFMTMIMSFPSIQVHTMYYADIHQHGWWYFFAAFPLMFLIHDTYFYWTHRLMHHRLLFRRFHKVHHSSLNPTPWAALSFNMLEAIVQAGIMPVLLLFMPVTSWHINIFFLCMLTYDIYGHLGFEIYPAGFTKHWLGKWINTSVAHNTHHQQPKLNYALYFTFWDRLMGTLDSAYDQRFEAVTNKQKRRHQDVLLDLI